MAAVASLPLDHSYARELEGFSVPWRPEAAPAPKSLFFNAALADELGLDVDSGALVSAVTPDGPAADAGLRGGDAADVISAADGEAVAGMDDVFAAVDARQPGVTLTLEVLRDGSTEEIELVLGDLPAEVEG